ncbi:hypothetical protein [Streptomyces pratensis]|uniref:hypothetical protein n=1 Tax=Streptomyces pratensis TaxID=1169025 RepID=UPI0030186B9F
MRHRTLAVVAAVATLAMTAACGTSADGDARKAADDRRLAASGPAVPGAPVGSPAPTAPAAGEPTAPGPPASTASAEGPKTPADEITPATGTFTREQKEYLADRVPRGMDPAAVLQTGQETCDKLRFLAKGDRDTAVGAIVTDEIPDAADAVAGLCPHHQDLVDEAAYGYPDGTHTGKRLRPGVYRSASPTADCSWRIGGDGERELASGTSDTGVSRRITIPGSARTFTSTGCYAWLAEGATG